MNEQRFEVYRALSPEDRMVARLKGVAEVINASGMTVICEDAADAEGPAVARPALETPATAMRESAASFDAIPSNVTLSSADIAALEDRLGIEAGALARAIAALEASD